MKQLTIDLDEYNAIVNARVDAENRAVELERELIQARLGGTDDLARTMTAMFRRAVEIVTYAEALLSPEFARKWPREALLAVADGLDSLPDQTPYEKEHAQEMRSFARDIARHDAGRLERYVSPPARIDDTQHPIVISRATGDLPAMTELKGPP